MGRWLSSQALAMKTRGPEFRPLAQTQKAKPVVPALERPKQVHSPGAVASQPSEIVELQV